MGSAVEATSPQEGHRKRKVLAYHVVLSMYGFWLPNDPRGSWSEFVRKWELLRYGPATKVNSTWSLAKRAHDWQTRLEAKQALDRPPVILTGLQARAVARGFGEFVQKSKLQIWACAIMPDHLHMVVARHQYRIEQAVNLLKGAATRRLVMEQLHPFQSEMDAKGHVPRCFAGHCWKVFVYAAGSSELGQEDQGQIMAVDRCRYNGK